MLKLVLFYDSTVEAGPLTYAIDGDFKEGIIITTFPHNLHEVKSKILYS